MQGKGSGEQAQLEEGAASPPAAGVSSGNVMVSRECGNLSSFPAMGAHVD